MPKVNCATCKKGIEGKYFKNPDGGATCVECGEKKVDDPSQSARAFYVSSPEPKD